MEQGTFRDSSISVKTKGHSAVCLTLKSYEIYAGKEASEYQRLLEKKADCSTLELTLWDKVLNLGDAIYTAYRELDAITRSVKVNCGQESLVLTKIMSMCLDMDQDGYDMITMHGSWKLQEKDMYRKAVGLGKQSVGSVRGESSHQEHPFLALLNHKATQESGNVYGFHFVYSGNFSGAG